MILKWLERLHDVRGDSTQIAPLGAGIHVDYGLHVVMVDDGGSRHRCDLRQITEEPATLERRRSPPGYSSDPVATSPDIAAIEWRWDMSRHFLD